jgi:hypothetical protein
LCFELVEQIGVGRERRWGGVEDEVDERQGEESKQGTTKELSGVGTKAVIC